MGGQKEVIDRRVETFDRRADRGAKGKRGRVGEEKGVWDLD